MTVICVPTNKIITGDFSIVIYILKKLGGELKFKTCPIAYKCSGSIPLNPIVNVAMVTNVSNIWAILISVNSKKSWKVTFYISFTILLPA